MASPTRWTWVWVNLRVGDGQGGLVCCNSCGRKESDMTEQLNWTELRSTWNILFKIAVLTLTLLIPQPSSLLVCFSSIDYKGEKFKQKRERIIYMFLRNPLSFISVYLYANSCSWYVWSKSCSVVSDSCEVHGILQARILECVALPFSRGSSQLRDRTQISHIAGAFFSSWATRKAQEYWSGLSLLQRIFLTQELNWGILHCRWILYQLSYSLYWLIFSIHIFMFLVSNCDLFFFT